MDRGTTTSSHFLRKGECALFQPSHYLDLTLLLRRLPKTRYAVPGQTLDASTNFETNLPQPIHYDITTRPHIIRLENRKNRGDAAGSSTGLLIS